MHWHFDLFFLGGVWIVLEWPIGLALFSIQQTDLTLKNDFRKSIGRFAGWKKYIELYMCLKASIQNWNIS